MYTLKARVNWDKYENETVLAFASVGARLQVNSKQTRSVLKI